MKQKIDFKGQNIYLGFDVHKKDWKVSMIVNPVDIPTTQKEKVFKEDKRDSRKIAGILANVDFKGTHVPQMEKLEHRGLFRTRHCFVEEITMYKQRIKSFLSFHGIHIPAEFQKKTIGVRYL